MRQGDNKWINQLNLNAAGQIVTWKMTKGIITMEYVEDIMHALCRRMQRQGVTLQEFYVDNCCALRLKHQAIFRSQLKVYLDIFHAVQLRGIHSIWSALNGLVWFSDHGSTRTTLQLMYLNLKC